MIVDVLDIFEGEQLVEVIAGLMGSPVKHRPTLERYDDGQND